MSSHTRTSTTTVDASAEEVWSVIDSDFLKISEWGPGVTSSAANPATPDGLNGSAHGGRVCQVEGLGATDERIVAYDSGAGSAVTSLKTYIEQSETITPAQ